MAETVLNQQEQKVSNSIEDQNPNIRLKKIIGVLLCLVMAALTAYVFNIQNQNYHILSSSAELDRVSSSHQAANYRAYVRQYKDAKIQLDETTNKLAAVKNELDQVSADLATNKNMLSETQSVLTEAQSENAKLKEEIQAVDALRSAENVKDLPELEAKIRSLKEKNEQVNAELGDLKKELRVFQADFANMEEGKSLITLFRSKITLVKTRMSYLKQEAYFAKIAAQKEKDRLAAQRGNNGFLLLGGQTNKSGNAQGFSIDVKIVQ